MRFGVNLAYENDQMSRSVLNVIVQNNDKLHLILFCLVFSWCTMHKIIIPFYRGWMVIKLFIWSSFNLLNVIYLAVDYCLVKKHSKYFSFKVLVSIYRAFLLKEIDIVLKWPRPHSHLQKRAMVYFKIFDENDVIFLILLLKIIC